MYLSEFWFWPPTSNAQPDLANLTTAPSSTVRLHVESKSPRANRSDRPRLHPQTTYGKVLWDVVLHLHLHLLHLARRTTQNCVWALDLRHELNLVPRHLRHRIFFNILCGQVLQKVPEGTKFDKYCCLTRYNTIKWTNMSSVNPTCHSLIQTGSADLGQRTSI